MTKNTKQIYFNIVMLPYMPGVSTVLGPLVFTVITRSINETITSKKSYGDTGSALITEEQSGHAF